MTSLCLFCGGDASAPNHLASCDGRQGAAEAAEPEPAASGEATGLISEDSPVVETPVVPSSPYRPHEHSRTTDPDTSASAAQSLTDDSVNEIQRRVLVIHRRHPAGLTDEELRALYIREWPCASASAADSSRKRRSDLTRLGFLVDSGLRRPLISGRLGIVWQLASASALASAS